MRVRFKSISAGPNGVRLPGQEFEVSDEEGFALIEGRYAELVVPEEAELEDQSPADDSFSPDPDEVDSPTTQQPRGRAKKE